MTLEAEESWRTQKARSFFSCPCPVGGVLERRGDVCVGFNLYRRRRGGLGGIAKVYNVVWAISGSGLIDSELPVPLQWQEMTLQR